MQMQKTRRSSAIYTQRQTRAQSQLFSATQLQVKMKITQGKWLVMSAD